MPPAAPTLATRFEREFRRFSQAAVTTLAAANPPAPARARQLQQFVSRCAVLLFSPGLRDRLAHSNPATTDLWPALEPASPLIVPNHLLCAGTTKPRSLRYFTSHYTFTVAAPDPRTIGLHILGRLFERSLPDRAQRRSHGVYYTPQSILDFLIDHTLGQRLAELRAAHGLDHSIDLGSLADYEQSLSTIKILDPACGSGAFLLAALHHLAGAHAWIHHERARLTDTPPPPVPLARLATNLHGVDIDEFSLELTRLTLSLAADTVLTLPNLRRGDALSRDFLWPHAYDCILGNPPYIKVQTLRQQDPTFAQNLAADYETATTGSVDLYLPFLERSLSLLTPDGLLGFVAPSTWPRNAHGAGLRRLLHRTRRLDRWLDFGSHQIFQDATTYTALQFYRGRPVDAIRCRRADTGATESIDWSHADAIPYTDLPEHSPWHLLPAAEAALLRRLRHAHPTLGESSAAIVVGLQTSADHIFHVERLDATHCRTATNPRVALEPALLRPLVSGPDAHRYRTPSITTHLLFPYDDAPGRPPRLLGPDELARTYPQSWHYLKSHESELRARERGAFDDAAWYRFGRQQSLGKQRRRKLGVAQTVRSLRVFYDHTGTHYFNNVRVNGILLPDDDEEVGWYLLGVLNGPVADFVFRRIAMPKAGGYHEANKQFIAPLPIPRADPLARADIARRARHLQTLHTSGADPAAAEHAMNEALHGLYALTPEERALITST